MKRSTLGVLLGVTAVVVIAAIAMAGNRNDNTQTPTSQPTTTPADSPATNTDQTAQTDKVQIQNQAFQPATITVKKGTTVTWTNNDNLDHTVTPDSQNSFTGSGLLANGDTFKVTFDKVGTFTYHCTSHPDMTGTVVVTE